MSERVFAAALFSVVVSAWALRAWVAQAAGPVQLVGDEHYYLEVAWSLATGGGHHSARLDAFAAWPPGQAFWLSRFLPETRDLFESGVHAPPALIGAQVALGALLVALAGLLGRLLVGRRVGIAAAALTALSPTLVAYSHALWATTLFTTLVLGAWCAVALTQRKRSARWAAAAGLLFGLAALTRESGAVLALGSAAWLGWRAAPPERPRAFARGALLLAICALCVLPWSLRNLERTGQLVPVSTVGWMAMREGNTLDPDDWMREDGEALASFRRSYIALPEAERPGFARREALARIRAEQPTWLPRKIVRNVALLASPESLPLRRLHLGAYGEVPNPLVRALLISSVAGYSAVLVLGCLGLTVGRYTGAFALSAAPLLLLHIVANASPRYRVPLLPLLCIGSGMLVCAGRDALRRIVHVRVLPVALLLLLYFAVALPAFLPTATQLWNRGSLVGP